MPGFGSALMGSSPAAAMARHGRFGDSLVADLTPGQAALLKRLGGRGTTNPKTGALEFWSAGASPGDADGPSAPGTGPSDAGPGASDFGGDYGAAEAGITGSQGGVPGADPGSAMGHDADGMSMSSFDTALTNAVRAMTRVGMMEGFEKAMVGVNQSLRDAGIGVVDGRGYSGPDGSPPAGEFGGGDQGNDPGGSYEPGGPYEPAPEPVTAPAPALNGAPVAAPRWHSILFGRDESAGRYGSTAVFGGWTPGSTGALRTHGGSPANQPRQSGPAGELASLRRDAQDTLVAHINPWEAFVLKSLGGRGTTNPETGALEFATADNFDAAGYLARNSDLAGQYTVDNVWDHYQQHGQQEGRVANDTEQAARDRGFQGIFKGGRTDLTGESYTDWMGGLAQTAGAIDNSTGQYRSDITGGSAFSGPLGPSIDDLNTRVAARDAQGFTGTFADPAFYQNFLSQYFDHDGDSSTPWQAPNSANFDRAGVNVSLDRTKIRDLGFDGTWGGGASNDFLTNLAGQFGLPAGTNLNTLVGAYQADQVNRAQTAAWDNLLAQIAGLLGRPRKDIYNVPDPHPAAVMPTLPAPLPSVPSTSAAPTSRRARINPWTGAVEYDYEYSPRDSAFAPARPVSAGGNARRGGFGSVIAL